MPSSGLQLIGFALSLAGLAVTIASTCNVQWKRFRFESAIERYEGLWMACRYDGSSMTCEIHPLLEVADKIQATRAVMLLGTILSSVAVLVSTVGMKCTRFMDGNHHSKSTVATVGGIIFMISGFLTLAITTWYVSQIVQSKESKFLTRREFEFGSAVFESWAGAILTLTGGAVLSCQRCSGSGASKTSLRLQPSSTPKSDYV